MARRDLVMNKAKVSALGSPCTKSCIEQLITDHRNVLPFLPDSFRAALAKLAEQDSEKLSDNAVLGELKLSSKDVEIEALTGDWV